MARYAEFVWILPVLTGVYFYFLFRRIQKLFRNGRFVWLQRGAAAALAILAAIPVRNLYGLWAAAALYFAVISIVADVMWAVWRRGRKAGCIFHFMQRSGILALGITGAVFLYAYVNMHRVTAVEYTVFTEKAVRGQGYDIVFLSDLHFGTTMGQEQLAKYCAQIGREKPDLVVLGGDLVDESTTRDQVREAFQTLGSIDSTFGVYYVYGNHDKGRYSEDCDFTPEELAQAVEAGGIKILEDETVLVNNEMSLTGRRDRSDARASGMRRRSTAQLLADVPDSSFRMVADHQPRGMETNAAAGCDLMLSGHTHAGQMWPVGLLTALFDRDTVNYGRKPFGSMELIVTSGIAGWGYPFRTGGHCEYVIVHVRPRLTYTNKYPSSTHSHIEKYL